MAEHLSDDYSAGLMRAADFIYRVARSARRDRKQSYWGPVATEMTKLAESIEREARKFQIEGIQCHKPALPKKRRRLIDIIESHPDLESDHSMQLFLDELRCREEHDRMDPRTPERRGEGD